MRWLRCCCYMQRISCVALTLLVLTAGPAVAFQSPANTTTPSVDAPQSPAPALASSTAVQRQNIADEIIKYRAQSKDAYHTMWGLFHIAILVVCIVLIRHTAMVTKGARFMHCFINYYTVTACFYAGAVLMPYFLAYIANSHSHRYFHDCAAIRGFLNKIAPRRLHVGCHR